MKLRGKRIVLGVTGGIAAYKSCELLRLFMQEGADVRVVMTRSATRFVAPLTFRVLSGHPVLTALYAEDEASGDGGADESGVEHIDLVRTADLVVVAPATANTLAKAAWGLADDALSTVLSAASIEVLFAPAMNHRMWKNPVTRDNITRLRRLGSQFVDPEEGWMACREHGIGRMASPETILEHVVELIGHPQDLEGVKVLVTAGRTEEAIDPVRMLTNRSSGRMGVALAQEAQARGAEVTLLAGPMDVAPPEGMDVERVSSAAELKKAADRLFPECDVLVMAAAVGDFRPTRASASKVKRGAGARTLELTPNADILAGLSERRTTSQVLVGFALETDPTQATVKAKLQGKGVDLLVINGPGTLGTDRNEVSFLERGKRSRRLPELPKHEVAERILDWVVQRRGDPGRTGGKRTRRAG